jgi:hypothetical protein
MITKQLIEEKLRNNIPLTKGEKIAWSNIKRTSPEITITPKAEQVILGSLLGDGCIVRKRTNCLFTFNHSMRQHDYAFYKVNILQLEGISMRYEVLPHGYGKSYIDGREIKDNGIAKGVSEVNTAFNKFRDEWYTPKKEVPDSITKLGPLGLAIWFMDDGALHSPTGLYLSTNGFNHESQLKLVKVLKDNFGITAHIHKNKDKEILYIVQKDKKKFLDIIRPYVCESMKYKFGDYADTMTDEEFKELERSLFGLKD